MFSLTILGNNSALPAYDRHPTSQVLTAGKHNFLIDCGEGTQMQMKKFDVKIGKISHIFISHLHGDHYFGLIGLINTMALMNRIPDLYIYGVPELLPVIDIQMAISGGILPFQVHFIPLLKEGFLTKVDDVEVSCFKTNHHITCYGFLFKQINNPRKINPEAIKEYNIPFDALKALQAGADFTSSDGKIIANNILTISNKINISYAFAADTLYDESIIPHIKDVDVLYHETTYLDERKDLAVERYHSTTLQAATIAHKANVKKLLIGHFSSRYKDLEPFLMEARQVFDNTFLAIEGARFDIE